MRRSPSSQVRVCSDNETCSLVSGTGLLRLQDELFRLRDGSAQTTGRAVSSQRRVCSYNGTNCLVSGTGLLIQWDVLPHREVVDVPRCHPQSQYTNTGPVTVHQHLTSHSTPTRDQSQYTNTGPVTVHQHGTSQSQYTNTGPVTVHQHGTSHSTPTRDQSVTVHQHGTSHSTPTPDQSVLAPTPSRQATGRLGLACVTSHQHARVSQGRVCTENCTSCHTEIEVSDQTCYLTRSRYTDTGPTSPHADFLTPAGLAGYPLEYQF